MVIVDTTVWVDYLDGTSTPEVEWFEREVSRQRLGLLDLSLCEILQGLSTDDEALRVGRHLRRFEIFPTGGVALATDAALPLPRHGVTAGRICEWLAMRRPHDV